MCTTRNANYFLSLVGFGEFFLFACPSKTVIIFDLAAILYYDYILTFGDEIQFVWGRKRSSVTLLFFANRYVSILGNIPVILQTFENWSSTVRICLPLRSKREAIVLIFTSSHEGVRYKAM